MPSPSEIRRKADGVMSVANDMDREAGKYRSTVNGIGSWWQGEGAKAFKDGYAEIDSEIRRLLTKMRSLRDRVNNLASAVQRAEQEDEKRRLAEAASKSSSGSRRW
ncbi:WXG100 family type VII secretion target [Paenibacillus sp. CAA11]|uniref:WXG100 family type VII secretion target n=1 Tax=Paenibacillus sp. CAA11 TaxID=1532905 RepID=UPI00131F2121|nr:WXG100 family type VII secretion target [Paenibacillus sp. CAA11]